MAKITKNKNNTTVKFSSRDGVASQATVEFLQAKKFDELSKKD